MFEKKGLFIFAADKVSEEALMEAALEAGADDVKLAGDKFEVLCEPDVYAAVSAALAAQGLEPESKQLTRVPKNTVDLAVDTARKVLALLEILDDHDDVQNVSANYSISSEALAELASD